MINLDTRILDKVDEDQMWLLLHITKRINSDKKCFPKNYTLQKDTGWGDNKVQKIKRQLKAKGLIKVEKRVINGKQAANHYKVNTGLISIFIPLNELEVEGENIPTLNEGTLNEPTLNEGTLNEPNISISNNEVLNKLSIKQIEAFLKEKKLSKLDHKPNPPTSTPKNQNLQKEKEKNCGKKEKEEIVEDEGLQILKASAKLKQTILTYLKENPTILTLIKDKAKWRGDVERELEGWCDHHSDHHKAKTKPTSHFSKTFPSWLSRAKQYQRKTKPNSPRIKDGYGGGRDLHKATF